MASTTRFTGSSGPCIAAVVAVILCVQGLYGGGGTNMTDGQGDGYRYIIDAVTWSLLQVFPFRTCCNSNEHWTTPDSPLTTLATPNALREISLSKLMSA
jgi:hypothetical protein